MSNGRPISIGAALVTLPIGAFAIYALGAAILAIGPTIWDSFSSHMARRDAGIAISAKNEQMARDRSYASACPSYFEASFVDKLIGFRHLSWCEDYADKMPK